MRWRITVRMGDGKDKATIEPGPLIAGSDAVELNVDATTMTRRDFAATLRVATESAIESAFPPLGAAPANTLTLNGAPLLLGGGVLTLGD